MSAENFVWNSPLFRSHFILRSFALRRAFTLKHREIFALQNRVKILSSKFGEDSKISYGEKFCGEGENEADSVVGVGACRIGVATPTSQQHRSSLSTVLRKWRM